MLSGSIVALITPFDENNNMDEAQLRKLCQFHLSQGTDGILIFGTTGEGPTLTKPEKIFLAEIVMQEIKGRIPVIAGFGSNSTMQSYTDAHLFKEMGLDAGLAIVPYYNLPTEKGCIAHFAKLAEAKWPIIAYNHPKRTGVTLSSEAWLEILLLESIVGIKDCSNDPELLCALHNHSIFCGNDKEIQAMQQYGIEGSISVIANAFPKQWKEVVSEKSSDLFLSMQPLLESLELEVNPQTIKALMKQMGLAKAQTRLPLIDCEEGTKKALERAYKEFLETQLV